MRQQVSPSWQGSGLQASLGAPWAYILLVTHRLLLLRVDALHETEFNNNFVLT